MAGQIDAYGPHGILSGGTKKEVKTSRPWQSKIAFSEHCPFCTVKQEEVVRIPGDGWRIVVNTGTPLAYSRLLVPIECWDEPRIRMLGGPEAIEEALRYGLEEGARRDYPNAPLWIGVHAGHGAGQNLAHLHWHIVEPPTEPRILPVSYGDALRRGEVLCENEWFMVVMCGVRAGQLAILPQRGMTRRAPDLLTHTGVRAALAEETSRVIALYNRKFHSPDFAVLLAQHAPDNWHVRYTPILNQWGIAEFAALDYGTPFHLPWPHAETVAFLNA